MSKGALLRSWKAFLLLLVVGLILIRLINRKAMAVRAVVLLSKYRNLMPYILAQAKHESANFKSPVYLANNNMFGIMWINGRRGQIAEKGSPFPASEGNYFYAKFSSDSAGVIDLLKIFEVKKMPTQVANVEEYAKLLKERGYYTDNLSNYTDGLKFWFNKA